MQPNHQQQQQRPDTADAFFNSFDQNSPGRPPNNNSSRSTINRGPPPGPPPPAAAAGVGQHQQQQQRGTTGGPPPPRSAVVAGPPPFQPPQQQRQQPPPPPAAAAAAAANSSKSYVLNASSGHPQPPPHQQHQTVGQPTTSFYAAPQPPPQQQQQPHSPKHSPYGAPHQSVSNNNNNDWYTPSVGGNSSNYGMMQPLQQPMMPTLQAPSVYTSANHAAYLEGTMDTSGHSRGGGGSGRMTMMQQHPPHTFMPQQPLHENAAMSSSSSVTGQSDLNDYFGEEPPLLEELGVNVEHILAKTKAVVIPFRRFHQKQSSALADPSMIVEDADLAGPLAFALLLGGELLVTGKLQFGYIYGFGLFGCLAMTVILNLMSPTMAISFWTVTSILGYALIPVNILAAVKIVLVVSWFGTSLVRFLAVLTVLWSTTASTRLLEIGCGLENQRYLLAYPIALLYSAFVLITIF